MTCNGVPWWITTSRPACSACCWLMIALPASAPRDPAAGRPAHRPLGPPARRAPPSRRRSCWPWSRSSSCSGSTSDERSSTSTCGPGSHAGSLHGRHGAADRPAVDLLRAADHRCRIADPHLLDRLHGARPRRRRFFAYLNLFVAAMLLLVLADNYLVLFVGWEGVGLASYLLIGFWQHKPSAATAAKKAFVVNRVGDFGLSLAIMLMFSTFGTRQLRGVVASGRTRPRATTLHRDRPAAAARRLRQVGAVAAAVLAARRDGGPDPGLGADPRRDHGHRRRLPDRPLRRDLRADRSRRAPR